MLSLFELVAGLLTATATFAWLNHQFLRLPANIGLLVMGLGASLALIGIEVLFTDTHIYATLADSLRQIDFYEAVMNGMLAFLLFAGALHVDLDRLRRRAAVVGALATLGVALSTLIIATGLWFGTQLAGVHFAFSWALVFGALIAPTDPVAVLSTLRSVDVPEKLKTDMSGEALFNDGIAVVLFTITLQMATGSGDDFDVSHVLRLIVVEAGGGAVLGLVTGFIAYRAMRALDDYSIEVMISLALVTATYALANAMHMSGPIAVVVAGVLIGNRGASHGMSDTTKRYVFGFWTLVDDILNAVLFLLIGLEVLVLRFDPSFAWVGLLAVPLVVVARFLAVAGSVTLLARWQSFARGTIPVLTWGGVRGGISVALALSLTGTDARAPILAATYAVVLFTIIVQGLTLDRVVRRTALRES
ncbi:sodium:proton antiporter [Ancylobacter sp. MQZ15Z-1]|uniref:Sodium:proton antiporter n=1 Tax=Ancylobacter mangrovi TaxID=2972472 RepID=A0A9X2PE80_9HYPH|nr:sodium:proton antiporter [Ancylobacter mangrovi]MCS0493997.1 sodium:proton antiporter [Ancylobacter mangrovi]